MTGYGGMTQDDLDREYSPSSCAPDFRAVLRRYAADSEAARARLECVLDVAYGPDPAERLDFFPAPRGGAPLQVFVHGGHWQELSKADSAFAAPSIVAAGGAFVALGYGLAPARGLPAMVASVRTALRWLQQHASELGVRADGIFASGSSAGAHLVAAALSADPAGAPLTSEPSEPLSVAGACLLSGVYDLEPVRHSYVNAAVRMDAAVAEAYSPVRYSPPRTRSLIVARGAAETREYARQHHRFVQAVQATGARVTDLVVTGRNHFDLPLDLGEPSTALGRLVLAQMGLG